MSNERIEESRRDLRLLLARNPNYFGHAPDGAGTQESKPGNTKYEELTELGYEPKLRRLEATFDVKLPYGFGGGLCTEGSREYVRFYVADGTGWQDVGVAAANVHDIDDGFDCAEQPYHPISHAVGIVYNPPRYWCRYPQLPEVRAILSWEIEPPPNQPDWKPPWGNVIECSIQIDKRTDTIALIEHLKTLELEPGLIESLPLLPAPQVEEQEDEIVGGIALAGPEEFDEKPPVPLHELVELYGEDVEPARFAFAHLQALLSPEEAGGETDPEFVAATIEELGFDVGELLGQLDELEGDTRYEELEEVGLDNNTGHLVAIYKLKLPTGYSGDLCSSGSTEYVAFWADWDDECRWLPLGIAEVKAYDFREQLPGGGLCYAAILPVDLPSLRKPCGEANVARIRAVLSWNAKPPDDPDALPTWGNRLDAHVQIRPGPKLETGPVMTAVGGVPVDEIDTTTGLTMPKARFYVSGYDVDKHGRGCPFGGRVIIHGPAFVGRRYRVRVREQGTQVWTTLAQKVRIKPIVGPASFHEIDPDGWFRYRSHAENSASTLAYFPTTGSGIWEIRLEMEGISQTQTKLVKLDNAHPRVDLKITSGTGDCGKFSPGTVIEGEFSAHDRQFGHFDRYWLWVAGDPSAKTPSPAGGSTAVTTPKKWTLNTSGMRKCGYVIYVEARDRTIRDSLEIPSGDPRRGWRASKGVGFCVN